MSRSIDSCQNKVSADQYHLTVSRAQVSTHRGQVFFWSYPLTRYWFSNDRRLKFDFFLIHMKYVVFMCRTIKILISNWPQMLLQAGKTVAFDFSRHVHALVTLYDQFSCSDWSKFDRWVRAENLCSILNLQGGKTFCASFYASFIAGSRRAFLCVDCLFCSSLRKFWLRLNEMQKVWTFAPRKAFLLLCGFCFSSLENYFRFGTTNVKGKTDHSVSLRWNKEFWTFPKRRVFFWLFIRFICELISPSFAGLN